MGKEEKEMSKLNDFLLQFGADKFMHFMVGAAVYGVTESWIILIFIAFGKELYDHIDYGNWSNKDVLATILGGISAFISKWMWAMIPFEVY